MAEYTIELSRLLSTGFPLMLDSYPVPSYLETPEQQTTWRNALNAKIIAHYYYNEICCLPPDRFRHFLVTKMNEIMPLKCKLYEALYKKWEFDTGSTITTTSNNVSDTGSSNKHTGSDSTQTNNITTNNLSDYTIGVASDTPDAMLNVTAAIGLNTYASAASKTDRKNTGTVTENNKDILTYDSTNTYSANTVSENVHTVTGVHGRSSSELFKEYASALRNLDLEIIKELSDCFMHVY